MKLITFGEKPHTLTTVWRLSISFLRGKVSLQESYYQNFGAKSGQFWTKSWDWDLIGTYKTLNQTQMYLWFFSWLHIIIIHEQIIPLSSLIQLEASNAKLDAKLPGIKILEESLQSKNAARSGKFSDCCFRSKVLIRCRQQKVASKVNLSGRLLFVLEWKEAGKGWTSTASLKIISFTRTEERRGIPAKIFSSHSEGDSKIGKLSACSPLVRTSSNYVDQLENFSTMDGVCGIFFRETIQPNRHTYNTSSEFYEYFEY